MHLGLFRAESAEEAFDPSDLLVKENRDLLIVSLKY